MRTIVLLTTVALLLTGCGSSAGDQAESTVELGSEPAPAQTGETAETGPTESADPTETAEIIPTDPATEGAQSPSESVLEDLATAPARVGAGAITGTLAGDESLEGGCAWLDTADGRYQVFWPDGYTVEFGPVRLLGPGGEVVAEAGQTLTVEGEPAADMMSVCQVGELWQATAVQVG